MTFTRKTGRTRLVENEAIVDAEVTRRKRNVKKTVTIADISSTSQRAGKRRVQEGSSGNPAKRKKIVVQPPSEPAVPKARAKVLPQKKAKKERAESVEALDDEEVVDKERSNEGPWLIKRYYKVDIISNVPWAYMKPVDISAAFVGISEFQLRRLGLRGVITCQYVSPNTFLLAKRRPRSIAGPIIHFVKSALQPVFPEGVSPDDSDGEEDTSMGTHPKLLDLAAYQFKCVRDKICQVKKHLEQPNNSRLWETFVGQVLTHLLIHLGIYKTASVLAQPRSWPCGPAQPRDGPYAGPQQPYAALRMPQEPIQAARDRFAPTALHRAALGIAALRRAARPSREEMFKDDSF
ncbi:hypothetical protein R1sor_003914 [Riccia sorocarpa]|uniref:Uncharacterized protein n=1 Tax=Riccia sorocarpa TaxID=122646 RepID=A0ABD3H311_9MARC